MGCRMGVMENTAEGDDGVEGVGETSRLWIVINHVGSRSWKRSVDLDRVLVKWLKVMKKQGNIRCRSCSGREILLGSMLMPCIYLYIDLAL